MRRLLALLAALVLLFSFASCEVIDNVIGKTDKDYSDSGTGGKNEENDSPTEGRPSTDKDDGEIGTPDIDEGIELPIVDIPDDNNGNHENTPDEDAGDTDGGESTPPSGSGSSDGAVSGGNTPDTPTDEDGGGQNGTEPTTPDETDKEDTENKNPGILDLPIDEFE
ncbi:MAG: hypothetical protein IJD79_02920 [Clostridia bacterium]|nr:hypothetical protein [Clostridia bacterium]